jgi:hypothetical protein
MKLVQFTRINDAGSVALNPDQVTCVSVFKGNTIIYMTAQDSEGKGLRFAVEEDYEFVCKALTLQ